MKQKYIFYIVGILILAVIILLLLKCQHNNVCSSFDKDDEGWTVTGDVQNVSARPDYHSTGGNPGGYLSATDETTGGVWYWNAPDKFLGSKKAAFNKKLQYDMKQSGLNNQFEGEDIILESADMILVYSFPVHPDTSWTRFSVKLSSEAGWKKNNLNGEDAGDDDLKRVLSGLTALKIRGEYITGPDFGSIDNVCLFLK